MKKNYFLTILFVLTISISYGQALLSENFDYGAATGDLTVVSSDSWANHSGSTKVVYITTSLAMANYPNVGIGGSVTILPSNSEDVNRTFTPQTSGIVYGSALINLSAVTSSGNYFIHFNNSGFRARVGAKDNGSGKILFGIRTNSSTLNYGTTAFDLNTTYLLVFSFNIASGESNLHVLSSVVANEPGTPEATDTDAGSIGVPISAVSFRQSSNIPTVNIDGVRVATTWNDIMTESTASLEKNALPGFSSYPNPVNNGSLTVITSGSKEKEVSIYNVLGKKVFQQKFYGTRKQLDVSNINSGIYIMKIIEGDRVATKKLVIR
ncbi:MAG: T9SS type A sorting domain-containing protein [Polaribacter sp.]|nr:T9SS type A sorting domain-containing protein [Polaribacter sp.]MDG1811751.1 T9SS type A sorting domain-containing protein [Polaribacter sp.]MDG1994704.1 T9SS type A sorting domain-containing protein [Polaribacter sp.]